MNLAGRRQHLSIRIGSDPDLGQVMEIEVNSLEDIDAEMQASMLRMMWEQAHQDEEAAATSPDEVQIFSKRAENWAEEARLVAL